MEGPTFTNNENKTPDQESFRLTKVEMDLSSDLKSKLDQAESLYTTMKDPVAKNCASLLSLAALISANVAEATGSNENTYQQAV